MGSHHYVQAGGEERTAEATFRAHRNEQATEIARQADQEQYDREVAKIREVTP